MTAAPEITPTAQPEAAPQDAALAASADHFMAWLKHALATRKLILNDAKALVHTVDNTAFLVSPGIFQRYGQEHPQIAAFAKQEGNKTGNGCKNALKSSASIANNATA